MSYFIIPRHIEIAPTNSAFGLKYLDFLQTWRVGYNFRWISLSSQRSSRIS